MRSWSSLVDSERLSGVLGGMRFSKGISWGLGDFKSSTGLRGVSRVSKGPLVRFRKSQRS